MKLYLIAFVLFSAFAISQTMDYADELIYQTCINSGSAQVYTDMDAILLETECSL